MKQEANATYDGRYVLAGTDTDVRPYDTSLQAAPNDAFAATARCSCARSGRASRSPST
jgi:flagellin-like hook-associated protein FlgL